MDLGLMDLGLMDPGATDSQIVSPCARTTGLPHPGETSRDADVIPHPNPSSQPPGSAHPASRPVPPASRPVPPASRSASGNTPARPAVSFDPDLRICLA